MLCPIALTHGAFCARRCFPCVDNTGLGMLLIDRSIARGAAVGKAISGVGVEKVSSKESVQGGIGRGHLDAFVEEGILALNVRHEDLECLRLAWVRSF